MLNFLTSPYFLLFARLCVGGVFLASSFGKMLDKEGTAASMSRYPFLPRGADRLIASLFPVLGLIVLLGLGLVRFTCLAALGASGFFLVFTRLIMYDLSHN